MQNTKCLFYSKKMSYCQSMIYILQKKMPWKLWFTKTGRISVNNRYIECRERYDLWCKECIYRQVKCIYSAVYFWKKNRRYLQVPPPLFFYIYKNYIYYEYIYTYVGLIDNTCILSYFLKFTYSIKKKFTFFVVIPFVVNIYIYKLEKERDIYIYSHKHGAPVD